MEDVATFEDLSIDDTLDIVERVRKYAISSIALQRLVHVKMLTEAVAAAGFEETSANLIPLLKLLATDGEWVVRQHLGEQLGGISEYCITHGGEPGYRLILETMLPLLAKLLGDRQEEVRLSTGVSLCRISQLMRVEDRGKYVLTIILQLAHDDEQEELRMTAAKLLNDIVESLGIDLCHQFVSPEIVSLAEDPVFRVRKAAALNMQSVCKVGGDQDTTDRLLPAYIRLTKDDIYRVRKACAESLVEMSKCVNGDLRSHVLVEVFLRLSTDSSKFVRHSALQQLGPFLATLQSSEVSDELLKLFTSMASPSCGDAAVDNEIRLYCAFSLPGVALTVGRERWGELREAFQLLVRDVQWNIRRTLAFSLHEVARVLKDPEVVEAELLFAFDLFLRDVDDVKTGALQSVSVFLAHLTPPTRESYLQTLCEMMNRTSPSNWRPRELLASQLPALVGLFSERCLQTVLGPLCFALVEDCVSVVRDSAIPAFCPLLARFCAEKAAGDETAEKAEKADDETEKEKAEKAENYRVAVLSRLHVLATSDTYVRRQLYVRIAGSLARSPLSSSPSPSPSPCASLFLSDFLPHVAALSTDRVANIRIALAQEALHFPSSVFTHPTGRTLLLTLLTDSSRDVAQSMAKFRDTRPELVEAVAGDLPLPTPPMLIVREPTVEHSYLARDDNENGNENDVDKSENDMATSSPLLPPPPPHDSHPPHPHNLGTQSLLDLAPKAHPPPPPPSPLPLLPPAGADKERDEQGDSSPSPSSSSLTPLPHPSHDSPPKEEEEEYPRSSSPSLASPSPSMMATEEVLHSPVSSPSDAMATEEPPPPSPPLLPPLPPPLSPNEDGMAVASPSSSEEEGEGGEGAHQTPHQPPPHHQQQQQQGVDMDVTEDEGGTSTGAGAGTEGHA